MQGLLKANGIPCEIRDKGQVMTFDGAGAAMTKGVVVRVPEHLLSQAEEVLRVARDTGKDL